MKIHVEIDTDSLIFRLVPDELSTLIAKSLRVLAAEVDLLGLCETTYKDRRGNAYMAVSITEK